MTYSDSFTVSREKSTRIVLSANGFYGMNAPKP